MTNSIHVKICGMQDGDDVSFIHHQNVSHIGLIFVPASRRYVPIADAVRLRSRAEGAVHVVGVFSDAPLDDILTTARAVSLDVIQLHGSESPETCETLQMAGYSVWKAISIPSGATLATDVFQQIELYRRVTDGLLFDTKPVDGAMVTGGHGKTFDWRFLPQIQKAVGDEPWFVAGGITPDNVKNLLTYATPHGIDVSSGVETSGRKDTARIAQLLKAVES